MWLSSSVRSFLAAASLENEITNRSFKLFLLFLHQKKRTHNMFEVCVNCTTESGATRCSLETAMHGGSSFYG